MGWGYYGYSPYVNQSTRRARAAGFAAQQLKKTGKALTPVVAAGRSAAGSFWGHAWCKHIATFSDYSNRLPRGMTYLRNGSVIDLKIQRGEVTALVSGSDIYKISIKIKTLSKPQWQRIKTECSNSVVSLLDLFQGKINKSVIDKLIDGKTGILPSPSEISMDCSCPDNARLCKHLAAVMYGIGTRLDSAPELLFTLRDVDHLELVGKVLDGDLLDQTLASEKSTSLEGADLGELFGIEIEGETVPAELESNSKSSRVKATKKVRSVKAAVKTPAPQASTSKKKLSPVGVTKSTKASSTRKPIPKAKAKAKSKPQVEAVAQSKPQPKQSKARPSLRRRRGDAPADA